MTTAQLKTSVPTTKKPLKKRDVKSTSPIESQVQALKIKETKSEPVKAEKKEKSVKKASPKKEEVEEVVEKEPKKVNVTKTQFENIGLDLSVAKVKNILANWTVNADAHKAQQAIEKACVQLDEGSKDFTLSSADIPQDAQDYIDFCYTDYLYSIKEERSKAARKANKMTTAQLTEYTAARNTAIEQFNHEKTTHHLFDNSFKFDVEKFDLSFNPKFYDSLTVTPEPQWRELSDAKLKMYLRNLISRQKVRFNAEARIYITAYIEFIMRQMVQNATVNCTLSNKKTIKIEHALWTEDADSLSRFPFHALIKSLGVPTEALVKPDEEETEEAESEVDEDVHSDILDDEKKHHFKYYVSELCRSVRMMLSKEDASVQDFKDSAFNRTKVSKEFKVYCSNVIIGLIHLFGDLLKDEVATRDIKTISYPLIEMLVRSTHRMFSIDPKQSIAFMQDRVNFYLEQQKLRKEQNKE